MAIGHIGVNDVDSINKINQAIDKANLVDGKAENNALTSEATARALAVSNEADARAAADDNLQKSISNVIQSVGAEANARKQADVAEATARQKGDATEANARTLAVGQEAQIRQSEDAKRPEFGQSVCPIRPGEAVTFFTGTLDGNPMLVPPLSDEVVAQSPSGSVAALGGAGIVAPIAVWRIEPAHVYRLRFVVRRAIDTDDPSNDTVRLGVRWLNSDKSGAGTTELANLLDITVSDGRLEYIFTLATVDAPDVDAVPTAGGVYFRPFVRAFGGGTTHVEVIEVVDATESIIWAPDVEMLNREIAGLNARLSDALDRIQTLENAT